MCRKAAAATAAPEDKLDRLFDLISAPLKALLPTLCSCTERAAEGQHKRIAGVRTVEDPPPAPVEPEQPASSPPVGQPEQLPATYEQPEQPEQLIDPQPDVQEVAASAATARATAPLSLDRSRPIRFLCLHGSGSNPTIMKMQTRYLKREFGAAATFDFVQGTIDWDPEHVDP
eukprot:3924788-Prymnesium_polylepis.1